MTSMSSSLNQTEQTDTAHRETMVAQDLDVRPLLARGEEPFETILTAAGRVPEQGALRLRAPFEPVPLYAVLARRGFTHSARRLGPEDWEVIFARTEPSGAEASEKPPVDTDHPSDTVVLLDVSDLAPPEPMVRILETASRLRPGQELHVEHHRRPVYLYPQLDAQGFVHQTTELAGGRVQIVIRRAEGAPE